MVRMHLVRRRGRRHHRGRGGACQCDGALVLRDGDVRRDPEINYAILQFIRETGAMTVVLSPGIIGCPHEEGIDYPDGEVCPQCPYWATRDRWSGEELPEQ